MSERRVIRVGGDYWTCRAHRPGLGTCGAIVPLPTDGSPPERCWRGHYQPWHGTGARENAPAGVSTGRSSRGAA